MKENETFMASSLKQYEEVDANTGQKLNIDVRGKHIHEAESLQKQ
jgi:hypothetical protein